VTCDLRTVADQIRPFVERRVAPHDVDDVMQEILQRAHGNADALDENTPFAAWVHRVARNAIIDHHRRAGRRDAKHEAFAAEWRDEAEEEQERSGDRNQDYREGDRYVDRLPRIEDADDGERHGLSSAGEVSGKDECCPELAQGAGPAQDGAGN
jgi:RNA polymerase sigma factor (sigma-70 family)